MTKSEFMPVIKCKEFARSDGTRFRQELNGVRHGESIELEIHSFHYDSNGKLITRRSESVFLEHDAIETLKRWISQ
jgi:hypothetical protein